MLTEVRDLKAEKAAYDAVYRAAHKKEIAAYHVVYSKNHKETLNTSAAAYYAANKERIAASQAAYREEHKIAKAAYNAAYDKANPEKARAKFARRRTKLKVSMDNLDRELSVDYRKAIANDPCFYCGGPGENDDHYVSLANGGTDHWWNLVRACFRCNNRKSATNGDEFVVLLAMEEKCSR
jgi:hypothetical protein